VKPSLKDVMDTRFYYKNFMTDDVFLSINEAKRRMSVMCKYVKICITVFMPLSVLMHRVLIYKII